MTKGKAQPLVATPVEPPEGTLPVFQITTSDPSQGEVIVSIHGLPGTEPEKNQNTISLWLGTSPSPDDKPLDTKNVTAASLPTSFPYRFKFGLNDYSITYQVSSSPQTMCAITYLNFFRLADTFPKEVSILIRDITTTMIEIQYTVLPGYSPYNSGNWIGLWSGITTNPGSAAPIASVKIPNNQTEGVVRIQKLKLYSGLKYTLLYFMASQADDPDRTTAGAALYIQADKPA